ncbi:MAG: hypothetical protein ACKV0T_06265 [Planctomycetales bacterium]
MQSNMRSCASQRFSARILARAVLVVASLSFPGGARAELLTLNQSQLGSLWDDFENPENAVTALSSKTPSGQGVVFGGTLFDSPGNPFSPFAQIGIGANFGGSSSTGSGPTTAQVLGSNDVSPFSGYALSFTNLGTEPRSVSIFLNTGFTSPPFGEPNNFYESGFVELAPGQSAVRVIDFDAAGVVHRNHVSNIGFQIGANLGASAEDFLVEVTPVPEPASLLLCLAFAATVPLAVCHRRRRGRGRGKDRQIGIGKRTQGFSATPVRAFFLNDQSSGDGSQSD